MTVYLDDYPIESINHVCKQYMNSFDWSGISEAIKQNGAFHFDVSDALKLFPGLALDERYALYCYVSREYHGIWGHVAAVKKDISQNPVNVQPDSLFGHSFELPDAALPPMEVIYNNGSPSGYFEALLAMKLLSALPYTRFEQEHWESCVFCPPAHFRSEWECYIDLPDWRPRLVQHGQSSTLYLCWRHFENGLGSSDGRDRIYLVQHSFLFNLTAYHAFIPKDTHSVFKAQLNEDSRYGKGRCCCVASSHQILLAQEKPQF